jgi:peptidoglycan/xylan/chitin deacetylase (PgdA/CDA1 family)
MPGWRRAGSLCAAWKLTVTLCLFMVTAVAPARAGTVVSLTFDDGQAAQYGVRPVLASHGMHGTFYVNSGLVGSSPFFMTWEQLASLAADGDEIGGHTLTHANLASLTDAERRAEICGDRENLREHGFDALSFAYPYGASDAVTQAIVRECGYRSARRVGGIASPGWCRGCSAARTEALRPSNAFATRTPAFGDGELTLGALEGAVAQAERARGGWVQLVFHGVCEIGPCGEGWVGSGTFAAFLDWLAPRRAHGTAVRTVGEVVRWKDRRWR